MPPIVFEGTKEEIIHYVTEFQGESPNGRYKVSIEPEADEIDYSEDMPDPPFTVRDRAHLFELLDAGLASSTERVTEEYWENIHREVQHRHDERDKKK